MPDVGKLLGRRAGFQFPFQTCSPLLSISGVDPQGLVDPKTAGINPTNAGGGKSESRCVTLVLRLGIVCTKSGLPSHVHFASTIGTTDDGW